MEQRVKLVLVNTIILSLITITIAQRTIGTDSSCWTPDNEIGVCVPIVNCDRITWLLTSSLDPTSPYVLDYVRRSHCYSVGTTHYGCCARHNLKRTTPILSHRPPTVPSTSPSIIFPQPQSTPHLLSMDDVANKIHNDFLEITSGRQPTSNHNHNHPPPPERIQPTITSTTASTTTSTTTPTITYTTTHNPTLNHHHNSNQWTTSVGERILNSMPCGPINGDRIANGESVRLSEFPWMALLEYASDGESRNRFLCGGSLITDRYVLTAAHCAVGRHELVGVRLGEHDLNADIDCEPHRGGNVQWSNRARRNCAPSVEDVGIERIIVHPEYRERSLSNDIALLRLNRTVTFQKHIKPICLPRTENLPDRAIVSGWGITERGFASDILLKAEIPIRSNDYCQSIFCNSMPTTSICAGGELRKSSCRGDSGSPLIAAIDSGWQQVQYHQFGIVSAGSAACGSAHNYPGVFTNIAPYMPWIIRNLDY